MDPGRELDALIAKKVMEWTQIKMKHPPGGVSAPTPPSGRSPKGYQSIPHYSTSIADAWTVVEKLRSSTKGFTWNIEVDFDGYADVSLYAGDSNCSHPGPYNPETGHGFEFYEAAVKTAPHAICLAALKAYE